MTAPDDGAQEGPQRIWTIGDYPAIARHLRPISLQVLDTVGVTPGLRVLDVGVGDGNTAIEAAHRGGVVTGIDLTPMQIERARRRAEREGVVLDLRVGDAADLPYDDASFDLVVSVLGAMFAPDHERAARELVRVCRPGGTVAFVAWADAGWYRTWRDRVAAIIPAPPPGTVRPDEWGHVDEAVRRFTAAGLDARAEVRPFHWSFPSTRDAADLFLGASGSFIALREAATRAGNGDRVQPELLAALDEANEATDGTCRLTAPYLLAQGPRR